MVSLQHAVKKGNSISNNKNEREKLGRKWGFLLAYQIAGDPGFVRTVLFQFGDLFNLLQAGYVMWEENSSPWDRNPGLVEKNVQYLIYR